MGGKAFEPASTAGYSQIKSVTGSNGGKTATVVFSSPFGDWQSLFGPMIPAHIAEKVGFNNGFQTFNAAVKVSGGPFEIQSYTQGQDHRRGPELEVVGHASAAGQAGVPDLRR